LYSLIKEIEERFFKGGGGKSGPSPTAQPKGQASQVPEESGTVAPSLQVSPQND
jgi:hypothetical protein